MNLLTPNPATDVVNCQYSFQTERDIETEVIVFNTKGETLYRIKTMESEVKLPITNLQSGLYFVKVSNQLEQMVEKLIIQ